MTHNKIKVLAALLFTACISSVASAQYFEVGGLAYNVLSTTDHTVEVTSKWSGSFYHGRINIPATVTYDSITYDVVALGDRAFYGGTLYNVTIPSSVTRIKYGCFLFASRLSSITVPSSVTDIEALAFASYDLTAINVDEKNPNYRSIGGILFSKDTSTIVECPMGKTGTISLPQNTKYLNHLAFAYCMSITGVMLPEGLSSIGYWAFIFASHLNNLVIPSTVSFIGDGPFGGCSALNNLTIAQGNSHYYMDEMAIYSMDGDTLVSCHKSADSLFLPSTLHVVGGFNGNNDIKHVHFPDNITVIKDNAFANSSLESTDLPSHLELLDDYAFYGCSSLTRVGMPTTLDQMGTGCFSCCINLTSIDIPNGLHIIPKEAFLSCGSLSHITWGDDVAVIDSVAFAGCPFTELQLPATLRSIRLGAFESYYTSTLRSVTFSAPIDTIEPETFTGHQMETLRFMNNVPPVTVTSPEIGSDYGCLYMTGADSIIIPCGSLDNWLADDYWGSLFEDVFHEDCNGIDAATDFEISVYPNPAHGDIAVHVNQPATITVIDMQGRTVIPPISCNSHITLPTSQLSSGPYYLRLNAPDGIVIRKVILQ